MSPRPWLARPVSLQNSRSLLFCIPHAGAGSVFFRGWRTVLAPEISVWPVLLPGRESKIGEPPATRVVELVEPLLQAILGEIDRPYALFGHSMGSVIAYELARSLTAAGHPPQRLFVSGRPAPQLGASLRGTAALSDDEFVDLLHGLNGTPREVLDNPELLEIFLPTLRADFELNESFEPAPGPRLACGVSAFVGLDDPEVSSEHVEAWREVTTGPFEFRAFPGDHFFHQGPPGELVEAIRRPLRS
ncbi:MAG: alpha/beta fold hydrolase [Thermoanaerobaculia bacterium]|nr:alpha/beta fold hydrolase [Thermoanaerobaculia bacterium]